MNPHNLFYIFLPALIFGSAFSVGECGSAAHLPAPLRFPSAGCAAV